MYILSAVLGEVRKGLNVQTNQLEMQIQAVEKGELEAVALLNRIHKGNLKLLDLKCSVLIKRM